jgi:hypothetical protein
MTGAAAVGAARRILVLRGCGAFVLRPPGDHEQACPAGVRVIGACRPTRPDGAVDIRRAEFRNAAPTLKVYGSGRSEDGVVSEHIIFDLRSVVSRSVGRSAQR